MSIEENEELILRCYEEIIEAKRLDPLDDLPG